MENKQSNENPFKLPVYYGGDLIYDVFKLKQDDEIKEEGVESYKILENNKENQIN